IKQIFWKHNILGFAPDLKIVGSFQGQPVVIVGTWKNHEVKVSDENSFVSGIDTVAPWWKIEGNDPQGRGVVVGHDLAKLYGLKIGDKVSVEYNGNKDSWAVAGILSSGGAEDSQIIASLETVQQFAQLQGKVSEVKISALVKPVDKLDQKDPKSMSAKEYETWYCSPYLASIVYQVNEVITSGEAKPIEQVVKAEDAFLKKVSLLVLLVLIVTFIASGISVMTTATANVLERRTEIGIMKGLGADDKQVTLVFLLEFIILGLAGGTLGYVASLWLTKALSLAIFRSPMSPELLILPVTLGISVLVAIAGCLIPIVQATKVEPARVLHGE
ncbi:MAG: ABC transporter permease, partial [Desulfitobacteriaceae bacterium]